MHHRVVGPPVVSYAVHQTARLRLVLLALWLPGVVLAVAASTSGGARLGAVRFTSLFVVLALSTFGLGALWRAQRERILRWNGRLWTLADPAAKSSPINLHRVEVRLDLQAFLLLRCLGPSASTSTWVWAERGTRSERWHVLRCALYHVLPAEPDDPQVERELGAA
ncbi:MAG: hypothetical protein EPN34_09075 [Burkholderiaceae bacterium]|nr:MAG: hypothetical protein EPN34_09075 [Burkholderiaceae bacterium]